MFICESGFFRFSCVALSAAMTFFSGLNSSRAEEPQKKAKTPERPSKLDTTNGFRGQKFGTMFYEFHGLALEKDEGDLKLYSDKAQRLELGPVKLDTIIYHFFQDKFFAVSLHTEDRDNTLALLRVAQEAFGQGVAKANVKEELDESWLGKSAEAFFSINPKTEQGSLFIRDNQIGSEVEQYQEKLTKQAADDL